MKDDKVICPKCGSLNVVKGRGRGYSYLCRECKTKIFKGDMTIKYGSYSRKEKRSCGEMILVKGQYWDTVRLKDGGLIKVIKLRGKIYPKGY